MSKFSLTAQLNLQAPTNTKQILNKIKSDLKGVSVPIEAKGGASTVKELNKVAKSTQDVQKQTKAAATQFDRLGKSVGRALTHVARFDVARRIFYGFASAVEQGITDAIQFERELLKVSQVAQTSMKNLQGLSKTITNLSTGLGVTSGSLAKTALILKQTGLSIKDVQIAMGALAKTELAPTFDNIATTAETAVAAMRQFRLEASQLEGLLGKINVVAGQFAVESRDIGQAIIRTGGAFKAAGGNVEELIALFTSVRATTRETAETIATGFRTIFTRLQRPKTIEFLRQFGIELTDLNGKFVGPYEAVSRLNKALSGLDSTDLRFSAIVEQLGGFRQVSKVIPLIQEFGTAQAALAAQQGGANSLTNDATKAQAALAVQLAKVKEEMKALMRDVVASEGFQIMIKGAMGLARALVKVGEAITPLIPMLTAMATIKLGQMAFGGFGSMMGRKQAGGRISRFSQGGWVPGSGNGDTVPALLEPGEFVLRKSAAQALGSSLNGVNRYASGGISKMSSGFARGNTIRQNLDPSKKATEAFVEGKHGFTHRSDAQDKVIGTVDYDKFSLNKIAFNKDGSPKYGYKGLLQGYATGNAMTQGSIFEQILAKTGTIQQSTGFGGSHPLDGTYKGGYAEVKRTAVNENVILDKLLRHENKQNKLKGIGLTGDADPIKFNKAVTQITDSTNLGVLKKKLYANRPKKAKKKATGFATGGGIFGSGLSPVLLTPGEFVVNKSSARAIGYGKLGAMNKYATGGRVGKGGVKRFFGGGMMGAGSMGGVDPMMFMGMETLNKSAKDTSGSIMQMGTGAVTAYAGFQMAGGAAKSLADQFGIGGEGLDMVVDGATRGLGAFKAMEAASAKMPKWLSNSIAKIPGAMDPKKFASGGMFGGTKMLSGKKGEDIAGRLKSAEKGVVEAQAHADAMRASTESIKENFRADDKARTARLEEIKTSKAVVAAKMKEIEAAKKAELIAGGARKNVGKDVVQNALRKDKGGAWMQLASEEVGLETERKSVSGKQRYERGKVKSDLKEGAKKNVEARKSLDLAKKENAAAEKRSKALKAFSVGLQLAAAAVGVFASKMKEDALKTIKEGAITGGRGEAAVQKAGMAGALGGAASGAQAGAMFGPWGMAIGGAVGALKGFIDATAEAEEALRQRRFDDANKKSASAMEDFSKKSISASVALKETIQAQKEMKGNAKDDEASASFYKQQAANTKIYLDSVAGASKSVSDFDAEIANMLPTLKEEGLIRQVQIDAMREEVAARIEAQRKMKEAADARQEEINNIRKLKGTMSAFDEATYRSTETVNALGQLGSPGTLGSIGSGLAGQLRPGSTDDESIKRLEETIDRLTNVAGERGDEGFGTGMGRFAQGAKDAAFVQRNVDTMALAASQGANITEDSLSQALVEQLEAAQKREGYEISEASMKRMKAVIAGLGPDIAADLNKADKREGAIKSIEEALKGSQQEMLDGFLEIAKQVDSHVKRMQGLYDKRNKLEMQYVASLNKSVQMRYDAEQQYIKNIGVSKFGGPTDDQVQENFRSQQRNLLGQGGLDTGMAGNVGKLASTFSEVRGKLDQNTKAMAKRDPAAAGFGDMPLAEGMNKLAEENAKLNKQYTILKTALQENTNATQRLSALQEALKREQEKQKTLEQLTFDASYGTAEEKDTAARLINAMNTAMQAGSVSAVDPSQQRQVAQMLMRLGPEGEKIVRKDQNKFLGMSGVAPTAAGGVDYQGITSASEKQIEIAGRILEIQESAATAQEALSGDVKTSINNMSTVIANANSQFLSDLKILLMKNAQRDIKQDEEVTKQRKKDVDKTATDLHAATGFKVGDNEETKKRMQFLKSYAGNLRAAGRKMSGVKMPEIRATGMQSQTAHMSSILDEFGANNIGNALTAGQDDIEWTGFDSTESETQKFEAAAALSRLVGSGPEVMRNTAGKTNVTGSGNRGTRELSRSYKTRDYTATDVRHLTNLDEGNTVERKDASEYLGKKVAERLMGPLEKLGGADFAQGDAMQKFSQDLTQLRGMGSMDEFGTKLEKIMRDYETLRMKAEQHGRSTDGFATGKELAAGEGTKRTAGYGDEVIFGKMKGIISRSLIQAEKAGEEEFMVGKQSYKVDELRRSDGLISSQKLRDIMADNLMELMANIDAQGGVSAYVKKQEEVKAQEGEIKLRQEEIRKEENRQKTGVDVGAAGGAAPSAEAVAKSTVKQEDYLKGLYEEGVQKKSSIAVRDAHCEAILLRIAAALEGGNGTASNPTSDTGGVAFTQSLDSRGFQDGVDKFSQTVDGLREVMAGALTIEVGGTVTLDINLKEGAGFLQDSQNALGVLVSGKINDAINNFIRNGLKDARINTGSWAADDSGTALASNSNTSGGMGLS